MIQLYEEAFRKGSLSAANNLGLHYCNADDGDTEVFEKGIQYLKSAANGYWNKEKKEEGVITYFNLGSLLANRSEAYMWIERAAQYNSSPAQIEMAKYYYDMHPPRVIDSYAWFLLATSLDKGEDSASESAPWDNIGAFAVEAKMTPQQIESAIALSKKLLL